MVHVIPFLHLYWQNTCLSIFYNFIALETNNLFKENQILGFSHIFNFCPSAKEDMRIICVNKHTGDLFVSGENCIENSQFCDSVHPPLWLFQFWRPLRGWYWSVTFVTPEFKGSGDQVSVSVKSDQTMGKPWLTLCTGGLFSPK